MRPRTFREGSVGLLILLGLGVFGALILWIRGLNLGSRSYQFTVNFDTVAGMLPGAPVRYRGVTVGRIISVRPSTNAAEVRVEINSAAFVMPRDVTIEANQVGLVGETSIDIVPQIELSEEAIAMNPLSADCDPDVIICDESTLTGRVGVSYDTLIRTTAQLAERIDDPELFAEIRQLVSNTADAAEEVAILSDQATQLAESVEDNLGNLSESAIATTAAVEETATQIGMTATQINTLLENNQTTLTSTLDNLNQASFEVQRVLSALSPVMEDGELIQNLEILAENAAQTSENLREISDLATDDEYLLRIQQTLDSAYETFDNIRKITADLDELTGDPQFRRNIRELVNGLSDLVSSTEQLQQQAQIAWTLHGAIASSAPPSPSPSPNSTPSSLPEEQVPDE